MKLKIYIPFLAIIFGVILSSCQEETIQHSIHDDLGQLPNGFPEIIYPEENEFSLERWALGKKLFFDTSLSIDNSVSCGSCHQQELAFGDHVDFSIGANGAFGTRNAPSLANVAYHPYYTREGGLSSLEMQVLVPIQEQNEFNHNIVDIAAELQMDSEYQRLSIAAYDRELDAFVIARALANFERTLISGNSSYDKYRMNPQAQDFSAKAKKGMELFFSERLNCNSCHTGFNFTNYEFENNGLYDEYADTGRHRLTNNPNDIGKFKIPSLRNIEVTGPYMHDGSLASLSEVIDHYSSGGHDHINRSEKINPFSLTANEKEDLILFLKSLTDHEFLNNPLFFE